MALFDWLFEEEERDDSETEQSNIEPEIDDVLLRALLNGETISRDKAMMIPAVSGSVDFICNSVASMPVKLFKFQNGRVEEVKGDRRVKLLNGDTGDTLDAFQMKKAMVEDYLMGKGGYCYIHRRRNEVESLHYVEDKYISVLKTPEPIFKSFSYLVEGKEYQPFEFIKILRNTKDGASGTGITEDISKELETAYQTMLYQLGTVQTGGNKKGFLKAQRKLGQEEINTLKKAWKNMYSNGSESVVVLNNGLEFQEASNSAMEMQLNESKRTLFDEISNLFHLSGDFDLTFKMAIYPIVKAFETALNRDLLLEKEKGEFFFEFDVKEIIKASIMERYNAYKVARDTGWITTNEIRQAENMNYVEGMDVINVGLGAVLYDVNKGTYYTPNTDTTSGEGVANGDVDKALAQTIANARSEDEVRFNPNHDGKTGRFAPSKGGGSSSGKEARIKELEAQLAETKGILGKAKIKTQIEMLQNDFDGTPAEWRAKQEAERQKKAEESRRKEAEEKARKEAEAKAKQEQLENELKTQPKEKVEQYKIIQEHNPMNDDYHVGIRKPSDIKSWDEVVNSDDGDSFAWGDFSKADAEKALKEGKITVYSSYPIKQGVFVSTSKIQSEQYAGGEGNKVYSKTIPLKDVAWINGDEGQFAKIGGK